MPEVSLFDLAQTCPQPMRGAGRCLGNERCRCLHGHACTIRPGQTGCRVAAVWQLEHVAEYWSRGQPEQGVDGWGSGWRLFIFNKLLSKMENEVLAHGTMSKRIWK